MAALAAASVVTLGVFKQGNPASLAEVPRTLLLHLKVPRKCLLQFKEFCAFVLLHVGSSHAASLCSSTPHHCHRQWPVCLSLLSDLMIAERQATKAAEGAQSLNSLSSDLKSSQ